MKILQEVQSRLCLYADDFQEPFRSWPKASKTLAASIYILFTSIGPAITFSSYLVKSTQNQYGVIEVLLSTSLTGLIFSLIGGQPLIILGVTGPVSIFSETVFSLLDQWFNASELFHSFMFWVSLWAGLFHIALSVAGLCDWVRFVTRFSCEVFGSLIGVIYLYTAIKEIVVNSTTTPIGLLTIILALGTLWLGLSLNGVKASVVFNRMFRSLVSDYSIPASIIVMTAIYYAPPLRAIDINLLPVPTSFKPSNDRSNWFIDPLPPSLPVYAIFLAALPGLILTVLFFFDHNVSSLLSQQSRFNLKKPSAYNWDFFVVGVCIIITGMLGLPPTNGLIPQAPLHVSKLAFIKHETIHDPKNPHIRIKREIVDSVVEQRVSNLLQSLLTGAAVLIPFGLHLLGSVPVAVLNGLFLVMGLESFFGNQFMERLFILLFVTETKHRLSAAPHTWHHIHNLKPRSWISFTLTQLLFLAIIFGVTLTPAAISFPVFIVLLVPLRLYFMPKYYSALELEKLDGENQDLPSDEDAKGDDHLTVEIELGDMRVEVIEGDSEEEDEDSIRGQHLLEKSLDGSTPHEISDSDDTQSFQLLPNASDNAREHS